MSTVFTAAERVAPAVTSASPGSRPRRAACSCCYARPWRSAAALTASLRAAGPAGALGGRGPPAGRPGGRLLGRGGGAAKRAHRCHHGARRACRPGDGGRTLDADRGGPRGSRRTGADLHRRALERRRSRSRTQIRTQGGTAAGPGAGPEMSPAARRSPGRVPCPIMGKLTTVANRIVDRGELCLPGEGASLSEHPVVLIRPDASGSRGRQVLGQFVPEPA